MRPWNRRTRGRTPPQQRMRIRTATKAISAWGLRSPCGDYTARRDGGDSLENLLPTGGGICQSPPALSIPPRTRLGIGKPAQEDDPRSRERGSQRSTASRAASLPPLGTAVDPLSSTTHSEGDGPVGSTDRAKSGPSGDVPPGGPPGTRPPEGFPSWFRKVDGEQYNPANSQPLPGPAAPRTPTHLAIRAKEEDQEGRPGPSIGRHARPAMEAFSAQGHLEAPPPAATAPRRAERARTTGKPVPVEDPARRRRGDHQGHHQLPPPHASKAPIRRHLRPPPSGGSGPAQGDPQRQGPAPGRCCDLSTPWRGRPGRPAPPGGFTPMTPEATGPQVHPSDRPGAWEGGQRAAPQGASASVSRCTFGSRKTGHQDDRHR